MALIPASLSQLYLAYLGRAPDFIGIEYLGKAPGIPASPDLLRPPSEFFRFASSAEYAALMAGGSVTDVITQTYLRLFNRPPEPAGLAYWLAEVNPADWESASLPIGILQGAQNADRVSVDNKLAAVAGFLAALDTRSK